ncbi:MAG: hypothetical protein KKB50_06950 [Planctomycetes bacterium]|nr:hypothetical protein [Planctomycetota bacterium]
MYLKPLVGAALLVVLAGCAPARLLDDPVGWPRVWEGRTLYTTPNACIYAGDGVGAGELDRAVARTAREYASMVAAPATRPVIIVRDQGETLPGGDALALFEATLRVAVAREATGAQDEVAEKLQAAKIGVHSAAAATGADLSTFVSSMPLACDARCLREVVRAPEEILAEADSVLILPTRSCLRDSTHRLVIAACKTHNVGPVARVLLAPLIAIVEARTVDMLARVRDMTLFEFWLYADTGLSPKQRQDLADEYRQRVLGEVEGYAAAVTGATELHARDQGPEKN